MFRKEIEIEFKSELTLEEYENLTEKYNPERKFFRQYNYYFDSPNYMLYKNKMTLRIRQIGDKYIMTLKAPEDVKLIETTMEISEMEFKYYIEYGINLDVFGLKMNTTQVKFIARNETRRFSFDYYGGKIFFDKTIISDDIDYEVEYEHDNFKKGKENFENFLKVNKLPLRKVAPKSERTINYSRLV